MIKYTTHYICYLNADNKVHCAKCRVTGKFVKRVIAQAEYSAEYAYKRSIVALFVMCVMFLWDSLNSSKMALGCEGQHILSCNLTAINKAMNIAYQKQDYILFKQLNRERFELIKGI